MLIYIFFLYLDLHYPTKLHRWSQKSQVTAWKKDRSKRLYFKIYLYRKNTRFLLCCNFRYHDCTIFALIREKALLDFKCPTTSMSIYKGIASRRWTDSEQVHFQHEVVRMSSGWIGRASSSHAGKCYYTYQS